MCFSRFAQFGFRQPKEASRQRGGSKSCALESGVRRRIHPTATELKRRQKSGRYPFLTDERGNVYFWPSKTDVRDGNYLAARSPCGPFQQVLWLLTPARHGRSSTAPILPGQLPDQRTLLQLELFVPRPHLKQQQQQRGVKPDADGTRGGTAVPQTQEQAPSPAQPQEGTSFSAPESSAPFPWPHPAPNDPSAYFDYIRRGVINILDGDEPPQTPARAVGEPKGEEEDDMFLSPSAVPAVGARMRIGGSTAPEVLDAPPDTPRPNYLEAASPRQQQPRRPELWCGYVDTVLCPYNQRAGFVVLDQFEPLQM